MHLKLPAQNPTLTKYARQSAKISLLSETTNIWEHYTICIHNLDKRNIKLYKETGHIYSTCIFENHDFQKRAFDVQPMLHGSGWPAAKQQLGACAHIASRLGCAIISHQSRLRRGHERADEKIWCSRQTLGAEVGESATIHHGSEDFKDSHEI